MRYLRLAFFAYVGSFILIFLGSWIHIQLGPTGKLLDVQRDDGTWDVEWAKTGPDVVPKNMVDAVKEIEASLTPEEMTEYRALSAMTQDELDRLTHSEAIEFMDRYGHMGLGMSIRNVWGLWWDSRLARWLLWRGYWHPDDMSAAVLEELESHIQGNGIDSHHRSRFAVVGFLAVLLTLTLGLTYFVCAGLRRVYRVTARKVRESRVQRTV